MYWDDTPIGATVTTDLYVQGRSADVMIQVLSQNVIDTTDREPFKHRMELTHTQYGMLINFSPEKLYSEWFYRDPATATIDKIKAPIYKVTTNNDIFSLT